MAELSQNSAEALIRVSQTVDKIKAETCAGATMEAAVLAERLVTHAAALLSILTAENAVQETLATVIARERKRLGL